LDGDDEDDEAHPSVPSERRGEVWSGDTMVRTVVPVGFLLSLFPCVKKKKVEGETEEVVAAGGERG
jgi:hypothetical protein